MKKVSEETVVLKSWKYVSGDQFADEAVKDAAKVLAPAGYDIELVEKHHNQKLDAPSGTALALADSINEAMDGAYEYVYDRSQVRKKKKRKEMGNLCGSRRHDRGGT